MNKTLTTFGIIFLFCSSSFADSSKPVDWNQAEAQIYSDLKSTQGSHTAAELEQALGYMLLQQYNRPDRAAMHFEKAVRLDPMLFNSFYDLGLIYMNSEKGNEYLKKAIKANADYPPPYYWLGFNYCKDGKDKEAAALLKQYIVVAIKSGDSDEAGRFKFAKELLAELKSGKDGQALKEIRQ